LGAHGVTSEKLSSHFDPKSLLASRSCIEKLEALQCHASLSKPASEKTDEEQQLFQISISRGSCVSAVDAVKQYRQGKSIDGTIYFPPGPVWSSKLRAKFRNYSSLKFANEAYEKAYENAENDNEQTAAFFLKDLSDFPWRTTQPKKRKD
jgi:hypothetical protein